MIKSALAVTLGFASLVYAQESNVVTWGWAKGLPGWPDPPAGIQMSSIDGGDNFFVGIDTSGRLHTWGPPVSPELEDVDGTDGPFTSVSAGYEHVLALSGQDPTCWGYFDTAGFCPNNLPTFAQESSGRRFIVGLTTENEIYCFGINDRGQCDVPEMPAGRYPVQVAGGGSHVVALLDDGSVLCWGWNLDGQSTPPPLSDAVFVAAGLRHSMAIRSNGSAVAWGWNLDGQCDIPNGATFLKIAAGHRHSAGITTSGEVLCWGDGYDGQTDVPPSLVGAIDITCSERATSVISDSDSDGDGVIDYWDECPNDPLKTDPGICGCDIEDLDSDNDGVPDCNDDCPLDPNKTHPGSCGCGTQDTDTDGDGAADCIDNCPDDSGKTEPGFCGCGTVDTNVNGDIDCDGDYDIDDVRLGMSSFGIEEAIENDCPEDLDQDETIGFADLLQLLSAWGPCSG